MRFAVGDMRALDHDAEFDCVVNRILTKLELHDRIQIVIFAETGVNRPAAG